MNIKKLAKRITSIVSYITLTLAAALLLSTLAPLPGNLKIYTVLTGSMEPYLPVGSLLITKEATETTKLGTSDIVTFEKPNNSEELITHRIHEIQQRGNKTIYLTKGDANPAPDSWELEQRHIKGVYSRHVPNLGTLLAFLKSPLGLILFIGLPVLLVVIFEIKNIVTVLVEKRLTNFARQHGFNNMQELLRDIKKKSILLSRLNNYRKKKDTIDSVKRPPTQPAQNTHLVSISIKPLAQVVIVVSSIVLPLSAIAALVSNSLTIANNTITTAAVFPTPTPEPTTEPAPTPSPSPSPDVEGTCDTDITVDQSNTNTGPGSTNTNDVTVNQNCDVNVETTTTVTNTIDVTANTGGNTSTGNTEGGGINTGDITIDLSISNNL